MADQHQRVRSRHRVIGIGVLVLGTVGWGAGPGSVPSVIPSRTYPECDAWIAARLLVGPDGALDLSAVRPSDRETLASYPRALAETRANFGRTPVSAQAAGNAGLRQCECDFFADAHDGGEQHRITIPLAALVARAHGAMVGEITAVEEGFSFGHPGVLLEVAIKDTLKPDPAWTSAGRVYVFHGDCQFAIGGAEFCSKEWFSPRVGDRVLFAPERAPIEADAILFITPHEQGFPVVQDADGKLLVAPGLENDPSLARVTDLETLAARVLATP